jgi:hypothetical protein
MTTFRSDHIQRAGHGRELHVVFHHERIADLHVVQERWVVSVRFLTHQQRDQAGLDHAQIRLKAAHAPGGAARTVAPGLVRRQRVNAFLEEKRCPQVRHDPYGRTRGERKVIGAAVFVFRQRPYGVVYLFAAQRSGRLVVYGAFYVDYVVVAHAHPGGTPAACTKGAVPVLGQHSAHLDGHVQRLRGFFQANQPHTRMTQLQAVGGLMGGGVDEHGILDRWRQLEQLHQERAVLENAVLPDGLRTLADREGDAHAQLALRGVHCMAPAACCTRRMNAATLEGSSGASRRSQAAAVFW